MRFSLCIATYNEEKNIHYPLDSAYEIADEVIIIDGGSDDKTIEKAKLYGEKVKVFIEENPAMFHINKQKAIERAMGDWILQLDADESLSDELKEEIMQIVRHKSKFQNFKSQADSSPVAYWIPRKNWFLNRFLVKGGQYPDYTIRLYRKGVAKFPCKDVHENVEIKGKIGYLNNPILHYADPNFSRYLMRWHRYNDLDAKLLKTKKLNHFKFFLDYIILKPIVTFFLIFFRHKGFVDGCPGFVFALFSSIRFWEIYIKLYKIKK